MCSPERQTETERQKARNHPLGGMAVLQSLLLHSRDLGHTCTHTQHEFKSPGPGLEPWLTTWESSNVTIMPSAGPTLYILFKDENIFKF